MKKKVLKKESHLAIKYRLNNDIKQKISCSLVRYIYEQSFIGQMTSLFCATVILIALYDKNLNNVILLSWYMFFAIIVVLRLVVTKVYFLLDDTDQQVIFWRNIFVLGALLGGLCWGFTGSVIFMQANSSQQTLIILILAGITAGAAPLLGAELISSLIFLTASLLPLIIRLAYYGDNTSYSLFSITAIAYYFYLMIVTIKLHRTIKESISLKFENDALLETLSNAKNQLEISNEKLTEVATHDPLTHAANRHLFETTLTEAINRAMLNNKIIALLYVDLDNFKHINDVYGHHIGDELLIQVVERLKKHVRESDLIARLGGDELIVLLENVTNPEIIFSIARVLCNKLAIPFEIKGHKLLITSSIGISIYPIDGHDAESLLHSADAAMYFVKENGKNNYHCSEAAITKRNILEEIAKSSMKDSTL